MKSSEVKPNKILVICASGIGNTILFTPTLRILRKNFPKSEIVMLVTKSVFAEPVKESDLIDEIVVLGTVKNFMKALSISIKLRLRGFDFSICAFPSNRWHINVFAFVVGAKRRITHRYRVGKFRMLSFLQNEKIDAIEGIHDVHQNLNLLDPFEIKFEEEEVKEFFYVEKEDMEFADDFIQNNNLNEERLVGIHPGAGGATKKDWQGFNKRWPVVRFVKLCDKLLGNKGVSVLVFGGPEEADIKEYVKQNSKYPDRIIIVDGSLKQTAAVIGKCILFISNDSGLMHTATAMGVTTIGIMGPTNYTRTSPFCKKCQIVRRELDCSPCLLYPFRSTSPVIDCKHGFECMRKVSVEDVFDSAKKII